MRLTARQLGEIAKLADMSEKAARRLLSRAAVRESDEQDGKESSQREYSIGLRLSGDSGLAFSSVETGRKLAGIMNEYGRVCPLVYTWLKRGDFDPLSIPENIDRGMLLHASRTAGRLRAKFIGLLRQEMAA